MKNLDISQIEIQNLITHSVGNKQREERLALSHETTNVGDETRKLLLKYFLQPLKDNEIFSFVHSVNISFNEVFALVRGIFREPRSFVSASQSLAKLLYESSTHPKIKSGELNVAYFSDIIFVDEIVDAVGIFKSETNVPFIKMERQSSKFKIEHDYGFEVKGIDKGCLIMNTGEEEGYRVLIFDGSSKGNEAQYWKDDFLKLEPVNDDYYQTDQFLGLTKSFITEGLPEELAANKAGRIDMLNRSVNYFKTHESFDRDEFAGEVFEDDRVREVFRDYDSSYRTENGLDLSESFEISPYAVRKQARVFKSIIKLDKNFHIYVHGAAENIEQGTDADGRKYYKIYYENEL